ncbi:MAG: hypothetical protein M4D80_41200 [Myxococcota bacterium]|nr:hypothetical protein [Myxococcota bacterium]
MWRSILAVAAGYIAMVLGVTAFFALSITLIFGGTLGDPKSFHPPFWFYFLELGVTPILAALGGYVCAWIAKRKQLQHAFALLGVGVIMGVVTLFADAGLKPLWSTLGVILLSAAGILLGAKLRIAHEGATR